ncbi:hypothetical protein [Halocatena pleomorpha]|uniref:Metal-dependent hydrolase n=1 Tax=Halocatena pleomorpha TaxID=1785090 RepID=A0A3P3RL02_9EURY|nr:hypothetical protein [Halocatena pleomorpha]RRJ33489.1 hypothetical protein EIK79_01425 [Halocatena pleomorpha]
MKSTEHAVIGAVISALGVRAIGNHLSRPWKVVLWGYGLFLSVFIDLDHFVLARYYTGDWDALLEALTTPKRALTSPEWLFSDITMRVERLLSHTIIGGVLTVGSFLVAPFLAGLTALVVYTHVLCDLLRDTKTL